ncbi:olfactory receptor 5G9-like [Pelodiscus sinensis]|uniref:olfactory receptor 5G9-like n=1 Tax=Pelodiscus sinensis TaxID=13735 RepID=UPI003F6D6383
MAYDRYVAICNPLLYMVTISKQRCKQLVAGACIVGLVDAMIQTCLTFQLSFCRSSVINHYFCDVPALLALSCSDYSLNEIVQFAVACFINLNSFMTILLSYAYIFFTVLQIRSTESRHKIFSTCACHLTAVLPLFVLFQLIYVATLVGNGGMIWLITIDPQLHTPMYFFLRSLSFDDLCLSTVIAPKMILDVLAERKSISYTACTAQMYFYICFGSIECLLLAVMAYDRYVAICNPLLYWVTMSKQSCNQLVAGVCAVGLVNAMIHTCLTFRLPFCSSNIINHFFCDIPPLLVLSCSDTRINQILISAFALFFNLTTIITILLSYVYIFSTILQMPSSEGWHKTFSTCACHLTTVVISYGTFLFIYLQHYPSYCTDIDKIASLFYTLVIPMLNPLIYSLRNREVKVALRRAMNKLLSNS